MGLSWLTCGMLELPTLCFDFFFFKILFYLFVERGEGREKEREGNISV